MVLSIVWQLNGRHVIRSGGRHGGRDKGCAGVRRVERVRTGRRCGRRLEAVLIVGEYRIRIRQFWVAMLTWL